jgi:hypothetical protein
MPMIIAGLVSAGIGGFSGFMGNKDANKKAASQNRRLWRAIKRTRSTQGLSFGQQEAATRKALGERLGGFDTARKEASRLGRGAKRTALDREQQLGGRLSQGLTNRGLGSTTVGANLSRGLASDTTRQLSDIDEGLASLFGELALGRSETAAGGTEALSNINTNRMNLETTLQQLGPLGGATLGNFQVQPRGPSPWMGALQGASAGLGQAMGGMGGGGFDPQMMSWLFSGKPGGFNPNAGQGMNLNTFTGGGYSPSSGGYGM